jgi:dGTPase
MLRRLLSAQVRDLVEHTAAQIAAAGVQSAADVRRCERPLTALSPALRDETLQLKRFLFRELYRHPRVVDMTSRGRQVVTDLFQAYLQSPAEMPAEFAEAADRPRAVADYVAGMTDRFAQREHQRLTGQRLFD